MRLTVWLAPLACRNWLWVPVPVTVTLAIRCILVLVTVRKLWLQLGSVLVFVVVGIKALL